MGKDKANIREWFSSFPIDMGVFRIGPVNGTFENTYINTRSHEGRVYEDDVVTQLPDVPTSHPLEKEWQVRKASTLRLLEHISHLPAPLILDIGCGNGWLTNQISCLATVVGLDVNLHELHQASRLFEDPIFASGNIVNLDWSPPFQFDLILFASSIQYFADLKSLLDKLWHLLSADGEVHIIDSPIYPDAEAAREASERTTNYYREFAPEMIPLYFHHHLAELEQYQLSILSPPERISFFSSLFRRKPAFRFPWIVLRK